MTRTNLKNYLTKNIGIDEKFTIISLDNKKCCIKTNTYDDKCSIKEKLLNNNFIIERESLKYTYGNVKTSRDVFITFYIKTDKQKRKNQMLDNDYVYIPINHIMSLNKI